MADEINTTTANNTESDLKAQLEELQGKYSNLKTSFDESSSIIADYKRKERERMSDEEKRKAEDSEKDEKYKAMERRLAIRDYSDELNDIEDDKIKSKIVENFADGKILDALKAFKEYRKKDRADLEKRIKSELMQQNPQATASSSSSTITKEEIMQVKDYQERQRLIAENISLFNH